MTRAKPSCRTFAGAVQLTPMLRLTVRGSLGSRSDVALPDFPNTQKATLLADRGYLPLARH